ncbi:MAG: GNAT family N-acetyltransferase [Sphingobacteriales bacterium]|nr:GNAT family N-acetyltransferase [Sphingobacteriales bacterium]MBI3719405.1 GNAT family N-acetyltransferase [Sphingobacteriales bacterium]
MIRKITAQDFNYIYQLYMHPVTNPWLLYEMMDKDSFQPIFDDLLVKDIIYIYSDEGMDIGMFKFIHQQHRNAHMAYLGGLAIHPDYAGKGYGQKMMQDIIALGKQMNLIRIELSTATVNENAIRLYEKAGFAKEGILRKYTWLKNENRFIDEVMMSIILV